MGDRPIPKQNKAVGTEDGNNNDNNNAQDKFVDR